MPAPSGINLSPKKKESIEQRKALDKIKSGVIIVFIGYSFLFLSLFLLGFWMVRQKEIVKASQGEAERQIRTYQKKESLEVALKQRMAEVVKIVKNRQDYAALMEKIQGLTPLGVTFQEMSFPSRKILLSGEAAQAQVLGDFLAKLKEEKDFSKITLSSLERTKTGGYSFSIEIVFEK